MIMRMQMDWQVDGEVLTILAFVPMQAFVFGTLPVDFIPPLAVGERQGMRQ